MGIWREAMTKNREAQVIIYSSFVLYAINQLLDKEQQTKGSTIKLKQMLLSKTKNKAYNDYVILSNKAWHSVVEKYKDKNYRLVIFDFVESIVLDNYELFEEMYGKEITQVASNFSLKQTFDGVEKEILSESREITKALTDATRKVVYDYFKGDS